MSYHVVIQSETLVCPMDNGYDNSVTQNEEVAGSTVEEASKQSEQEKVCYHQLVNSKRYVMISY